MKSLTSLFVLALFLAAISASLAAADDTITTTQNESSAQKPATGVRKPASNEQLSYPEQELNNFDPAKYQQTHQLPVDTD